MRHVSRNTLLIVLVAFLLVVGTTQLLRALSDDPSIQVQFRAAISHPNLLSGKLQTTYIKVDLTGFEIEQPEQRAPVNIALVLDKSGSMNGRKLQQAKKAAIMAIKRLGPGDIVSVVAYDNTTEVLVPATEVVDKRAITERIRSLRAHGGTALYAGVHKGAETLNAYLDANRVNRVILLSDGEANEGPSTPTELGELGATLSREGITVTTIGLGLSYNEDLMTQLAQRSDGNHSFVEHVDDLAHIFDQEFGDVLSVVAQDVTVTIDCNEGIRPVRVLGRDAEINDRQVTVALNQLYSKQDKYIVLEVETTPTATSGKQDVARVTTSYANMLTHSTEVLTQSISAQITESEEEVKKNIDKEAMVAAVEQQGIINEEKAILLRDQGRHEEAEQMLQENAAFLEDEAALYEADELYMGARKSREAASNLDDQQWNRQRKTMRSDHYRTKSQQKY